MKKHLVITNDYPENHSGGFLICGINFGYSAKEENLESQGLAIAPEPLSFFSDQAVNKTRFRDRALRWLSGWGLTFATQSGQEGGFERSFFQTNWLNNQTRSITSDGPITVNTLVEESASFLQLLEQRRPSVIFFFGRDPMEALNDTRIRDRVVSILGERSGNAVPLTAEVPEQGGTKWKMLVQKFGETIIVGLPHPQTRGVTDAYMAELKPPVQVMQRLLARATNSNRVDPVSSDQGDPSRLGLNDPLFPMAQKVLTEDEEFPVSLLQRRFKIGYTRALKMYEALSIAK